VTSLSLPLLGPLAWIDVVLLGWFVLTTLSTAYIAYDSFLGPRPDGTRGNPEPAVMKWGWVLVGLYMGPIALGLYVLADKEPRPGTHEAFVSPLWRQGIGSTVHCVAGDATGIVLAATATALLGFPMWVDLIAEYAFGFAFGLFVFQALFMKGMMGGSYWRAVTGSFLPEWLSMNLMMAGMIPPMVLLMMGQDMRAMDPGSLLYWGTMSVGVTAGYFAAYPVNLWLVSKGLKHGLMTVRAQPALAAPAAAPNGSVAAANTARPAPAPHAAEHASHPATPTHAGSRAPAARHTPDAAPVWAASHAHQQHGGH
jgi:manganese oxidase